MASYVSNNMNTYITTWLNDNVNPVGSAVTIDKSLSIEGSAADAYEVGKLKENLLPFDITFIEPKYENLEFSESGLLFRTRYASAAINNSYCYLKYTIDENESFNYIEFIGRCWGAPTDFPAVIFFDDNQILLDFFGNANTNYYYQRCKVPTGTK